MTVHVDDIRFGSAMAARDFQVIGGVVEERQVNRAFQAPYPREPAKELVGTVVTAPDDESVRTSCFRTVEGSSG
jgi:hypothetical protein